MPYNEGRKDLAMANQRSFSVEFKKQVIQELLSGESTPAQLCRRHNIGASLLYHGLQVVPPFMIRFGVGLGAKPHPENAPCSLRRHPCILLV
jgi:hypothetical protein